MKSVEINGRKIGAQYEPYVIAELSANHNGDLNRALKIIEMAKLNGADAIKLQTYTPDTMTIECDLDDFQIKGGLWGGNNLYQLYEKAQTPFEWHQVMFEYARKIDLTCFSTPFDESAVDLLEDLNVQAYKIASFEAIDIPLIKYVAKTNKPMIISTGMANLNEIEEAVDAAKCSGCKNMILLHCISGYPTPPEQSNLRTISDLAKRFDVVAGLSDHTLGTTVSVASIAMGACVIEKHVTLSRADKGPDSEFSLEPTELKTLCTETKIAWSALGEVNYDRKPVENENVKYRRSIYIVKDIKEGEKLTKENIRRIRPGFGLAPKYYDEVLGKTINMDLSRGTALSRKHLK